MAVHRVSRKEEVGVKESFFGLAQRLGRTSFILATLGIVQLTVLNPQWFWLIHYTKGLSFRFHPW